MKLASLLAAMAAILCGQNSQDVVRQGEQVFAKSCSTGYCHGPRGAAGGAPRLAGRGFDENFITTTVTAGVPGTGMASFAATLSRADLAAVVAYVANLNGISNPTVSAAAGRGATAEPSLSAEAARGRSLFSDAVRSFGRCSTCHEVNGIGVSVATPISQIPANAQALRSLTTPQVSTATIAGEAMPALLVSKTSRAVIFYDLTTSPPVLRNAQPASVSTGDGSAWKHSSAVAAYSDPELEAVLAYLRAAIKP